MCICNKSYPTQQLNTIFRLFLCWAENLGGDVHFLGKNPDNCNLGFKQLVKMLCSYETVFIGKASMKILEKGVGREMS